jgi:hypothetical protein
MKCPKCHTDNPDESKFCMECADPGMAEVDDARERLMGLRPNEVCINAI